MNITLAQIVVWGIIGILAGSLSGMFLKQAKTGIGGLISKLLIGLMGALIGGALFDILNINLGLGTLTIAFEDLLAALVGSLIFLIVLIVLQK